MHKTWLLVHLFDFKVEAFRLAFGPDRSAQRYPKDLKELLEFDRSEGETKAEVPLDAWGTPLHYELRPDGTHDLRSAGPDCILHTADDVTPRRP